jgi:IS5 family transposase
MTAAQKTAKANFKKAIEYRKKTGVSLKEAFAHVYGRKVGAAPKKKATKKAAPKKAAKKVVKKAAPKKVAKKAAPKKLAKKKHTKYGKVKAHTRRVAGVKKAESIHKDTKSHNVNIRVVSGLPSYKNAVRVYFSNPKYNYTTSVGPNVTEEMAKQYFLGKFFNVGVYPKEILQKPTRIKFFKYIDK